MAAAFVYKTLKDGNGATFTGQFYDDGSGYLIPVHVISSNGAVVSSSNPIPNVVSITDLSSNAIIALSGNKQGGANMSVVGAPTLEDLLTRILSELRINNMLLLQAAGMTENLDAMRADPLNNFAS